MADDAIRKGPGTLWPDDSSQAPMNVYLHPPKNKKYKAKWLVLWQSETDTGLSMSELVESNALNLTEWRVLGWIMCHVGIGNAVTVNQAEVCRKLHIYKANASNAVKRLVELGVITKVSKAGRSNTYAVSPAFCFAGALREGEKQRKACIEAVKPKGKAS